jgi:hypothetical protein
MKVSLARIGALSALLIAASAAFVHAESNPGTSTSTELQAASFGVAETPVVLTPAVPNVSLALTHAGVPEASVLGVHYRPRESGSWGRNMDSQAVSQVHLGFFDPEDEPSREFLLGIRGGPMVDPHVQLGFALDWSHISTHVTSASHQSLGPNGYNPTVWQDVSRSSSHLITAMPYVQVSGTDDMPVIPYFGVGGGYELLYLSADNYQDQSSFSATYGGWGWQVWTGAAIPLSGQLRVNGEVFFNTAEPSREVNNDPRGDSYREVVKASGAGLRLGMAWGF